MSNLRFGHRSLDQDSFENLEDSSRLLADPPALRKRLQADGYLLLRGFHDKEKVLAARQRLLEDIAAAGRLSPEGAQQGYFFGKTVAKSPAIERVLCSPKLFRLSGALLDTDAVATFDFKWIRGVAQDAQTNPHMDIVYMGRGTKQGLTVWTPFGEVAYEDGPLAVLVGSHSAESTRKLRETYGRLDVDEAKTSGWVTDDPYPLGERYGLRWATTQFEPGDVMVFGWYLLHASLRNQRAQHRLSSDVRFQRRAEAMDPRWVGENPPGHLPDIRWDAVTPGVL